MFTKKTRVLIGSLFFVITVIITVRFAWNTLVEWITDTTLPLIQTANSMQELLPNIEINAQESCQTSDVTKPADVIIIQEKIPTTIIIEQQVPEKTKVFIEQKKLPQKGHSRTARRRKKKNTETNVQLHEEQVTTKEKKSETFLIPYPESIVLEPENKIFTQTRSILVLNKIDVNALAVKHWTGNYSPTKLEITLNGISFNIVGNDAVAFKAIQEIPIQNNTIIVQYIYEFMNGMRKGSDTVTYTVSENAIQLELRFSWDTAWHVELDGAHRE